MWRKHIRKSEYICQSKSLSFKKLLNTNSISSIIRTCTHMLKDQILGVPGEGAGRQGSVSGCKHSCSWCQPCSERRSMDLPAGSCLLPGRERPPSPAELLPVCFSSGLGREKPNHTMLEGADPSYREEFAHFYNPCGWRRPELAGFFSVYLPKQFEQSAFSVSKSRL